VLVIERLNTGVTIMLEQAEQILNDLNATWPNDESVIFNAVELSKNRDWNRYVNVYTTVLLDYVLERQTHSEQVIKHARHVVDVANKLAKWW
jgi:hypothetical protein